MSERFVTFINDGSALCRYYVPYVELLADKLRIDHQVVDTRYRKDLAEKYKVLQVPSIYKLGDGNVVLATLVGTEPMHVVKAFLLGEDIEEARKNPPPPPKVEGLEILRKAIDLTAKHAEAANE